MLSSFYALLYRLRYTLRWSGTYVAQPEDVAEHSYSVALITHALCEIKQTIYGEQVDIGRTVIYALYHDASDAILTHIISPVKNHKTISEKFQSIKKDTNKHIVNMLPKELLESYNPIFDQDRGSEYTEIVHIADQLDAYIKSKMELRQGNLEFSIIYKELEAVIEKISLNHEYVSYFVNVFLPSFEKEEVDYRYLNNEKYNKQHI